MPKRCGERKKVSGLQAQRLVWLVEFSHARAREERKMERRSLSSKRERAALWLAAKGKCQWCGEPLGQRWEADHTLAFKWTGRTNVHEMQALCRRCNRRK